MTLDRLFRNTKDETAESFEDKWSWAQATAAEDPPYVVAALPAYNHDAVCPKCHYIAGTTTYRRGYHGIDCAIPETPHPPYASIYLGEPSREDYLRSVRHTNNCAAIPEHFDRECPNCSYKWSESVA